MKLSPYVKAVVAAVGTVVTALVPVVADNVFDASEVQSVSGALVAAALTVYGVWKAENKDAEA